MRGFVDLPFKEIYSSQENAGKEGVVVTASGLQVDAYSTSSMGTKGFDSPRSLSVSSQEDEFERRGKESDGTRNLRGSTNLPGKQFVRQGPACDAVLVSFQRNDHQR